MSIIKITPEMFRELDILTRTEVGCPLSIFDHQENDEFGFVSFQPEGVYRHLAIREAHGCCCEKVIIHVANQIDIDEFYCTRRPEMNYGRIPEWSIYRFIVLHEIGHRLFDIPELLLSFPLSDRDKVRLFLIANEVRADRYAWKNLFPWESFPLKSDDPELLKRVKSFRRSYRDCFLKKPRDLIPISTDPGEMVPIAHVENGIPWAMNLNRKEVKPLNLSYGSTTLGLKEINYG